MPSVSDLEHGDLIKDRLPAWGARRAYYTQNARYYEGDHSVALTGQKWAEKYGGVFQKFSANLCPLVVDTISGRLILERFEGVNAEPVMKASRLDAVQRLIHRDCMLFGDAYAAIWEVDSKMKICRQHPSLILPVPMPDDPDELAVAVKIWKSRPKVWRITVYYADRAERYQFDGESFDPSSNLTLQPYESGTEPHVFEHSMGRVPICWFANRSGAGEWGTSELDVVRPLQDALNKAWSDMLAQSEANSIATRFIAGLDPQLGKDGKPIDTFTGRPIWTSADPETTFGQFPFHQLDGVTQAVAQAREDIARVSGVPMYYLTPGGQPASGAALRQVEAPLRTKVEAAQALLGNVWEDAMRLATGSEGADISAVWRDTAPVSDIERLDQAESKVRLGFSRAQAMREMGYTDLEIRRIQAEREVEDDAAAARQARLFSRDPSAPGE